MQNKPITHLSMFSSSEVNDSLESNMASGGHIGLETFSRVWLMGIFRVWLLGYWRYEIRWETFCANFFHPELYFDWAIGAAPTGDAPTTSEWSTISLPTQVRLILETWRVCNMWIRVNNTNINSPISFHLPQGHSLSEKRYHRICVNPLLHNHN